jgi:deoxyribodipyrimidine photo-lyase
VDDSVAPSPTFHGGELQAHTHLERFLSSRLADYATHRNDPEKDWLSGMSPYLHFGHISPVEIALQAIDYAESALAESERAGVDTLLEELIVRRELAMNYAEYNDRYDSYAALPDWAQQTLAEHEGDPRPYAYSLDQLEQGATDDPYWNACQLQMVKTGKMHGYMRMYWGKKILEWTAEPTEAFRRTVYLNDRYELDGRDPNGYAGVAWVFGKHDRPWAERSIFGKVRYMNANGLRRKFKEIDRYVDRWTSS